jgi:uncharacterized protein (DUF4415 family)
MPKKRQVALLRIPLKTFGTETSSAKMPPESIKGHERGQPHCQPDETGNLRCVLHVNHSSMSLRYRNPPRRPRDKQLIAVRLDRAVLEWLKSYGEGYSTRLNGIPRIVMEQRQP